MIEGWIEDWRAGRLREEEAEEGGIVNSMYRGGGGLGEIWEIWGGMRGRLLSVVV